MAKFFLKLSLFTGGTLLFGVLFASSARAALGQAPSQAGAASMQAAASSPNRHLLSQAKISSLYSVHDYQLESGTQVREFATPDNIVFAVVWRGAILPDLSVLLGAHFSTFKAEAERTRAKSSRGTPLRVESKGLTLNSGGRMRHFTGYAYLKDIIPAGVHINDLLQ